jgi:beta-glucosidase
LSIEDCGVTFSIKNTGEFDGEEIAQLYVNRELKGWQRLHIKKGENVAVAIFFDDKTFRYYDEDSNKWAVLDGEHDIQIGVNVADIRLSGKLTVAGTSPREEIVSYPIQPNWLDNCLFTRNNTIGQLKYSKSVICRLVEYIYARMIHKRMKKNKPNLNMILGYNLPFRGIARQAGESFSIEMVDGIVMIANGRFFHGAARVIGGFFSNKKANKEYKSRLIIL